jgi:DNA helicase-2/ATP-dependent DNA helicase PcrA
LVNGMVDESWFFAKDALLNGAGDVAKLKEMRVGATKDVEIRRPYSVTSDILAFRNCSRQYGYFGVRNYAPAQTTQLYFGIVIHQTLDRAHHQFRGMVEGKPKGVPSDKDIEEYFHTITSSLRARGIRPYSAVAEGAAKEYLIRFNSKYGPELYPRVVNTEQRLQADMKDFYLHGVVDVLATTPGNTEELEIWDYKGSAKVEDGSPEMKNYEFQMRVYAELYKQKVGKYPVKAVLCFLAEESLDNMKKEIKFDEVSTAIAMKTFVETVAEIEARRAKGDWSPPVVPPSIKTCGSCDIRWDCSTARRAYKFTMPSP